MPESVARDNRPDSGDSTFSIIIPSWNNLPYLRLCVRSILENSGLKHQIIIVVNEGTDGTLEWVKAQGDIDYLHAQENIGICRGLNRGREVARTGYILYMNDDMYVLPGWDRALSDEIQAIGHNRFMLSSTMVEPLSTGNPCVIVKDYGRGIDRFDEQALLAGFGDLEKEDWSGSTWPPNVVHKDLWDEVGGLSEEFSPGMYSDPDFARKLWEAGVRYFKGLGRSRVYHFASKTTGRIKRNPGRRMFLKKWGMTSRSFTTHYLRMGEPFSGPLPDPETGFLFKLKNRLQHTLEGLRG